MLGSDNMEDNYVKWYPELTSVKTTVVETCDLFLHDLLLVLYLKVKTAGDYRR